MRTFLTVIMALVCAFTFAQKKPKINKAKSALEDGELSEAKAIIDQAIIHEKTKDDAKTWFYRGMIYSSLDTALNEPGAMNEAIEAYNKALEIDPEQKSINTITPTGGLINVDSKLNEYYSYYYNEAVTEYTAEDFENASLLFEKAFMINPKDTNAILNTAYAASAAQNDSRAKESYEKALESGAKDKSIFLQLYNLALKEEDYNSALEAIRQGKELHPNFTDFNKYEINLLIELDQVDEAKDEILKAIEKEPENADLWFSLGVLKEESGDVEGGLVAYREAIKIDSDHFNSNFNLGVSLFNESNEMIKERNKLGYKETKKYDELTKKINTQLEKALPVWEKLYSLNSADRTILETLSYIYTSLNMSEKSKEIEVELEKLDN